MDAKATNDYDTAQKFLSQGRQTCLTYELIPTPMSRDYKGDTAPHERNGVVQTDTVERAIFHSGEVLLGTPRTSTANGSTASQVEKGAPKARIEDQVHITEWGKFEPAIRRWEEVLGRPAPAPTKPDGKDGGHRLSSAFTEWMMGLPEGWITDVGLSRNEELKACGNGVVPQQAELALRMLLEGVPLPETQESISMFPTPTVSDIYTGNLASSQMTEGSMHSVTLPRAIKMVVGK
jgi:DNA (cytosine-5)-methyltransferase 1